jgi:hypothetical protein
MGARGIAQGMPRPRDAFPVPAVVLPRFPTPEREKIPLFPRTVVGDRGILCGNAGTYPGTADPDLGTADPDSGTADPTSEPRTPTPEPWNRLRFSETPQRISRHTATPQGESTSRPAPPTPERGSLPRELGSLPPERGSLPWERGSLPRERGSLLRFFGRRPRAAGKESGTTHSWAGSSAPYSGTKGSERSRWAPPLQRESPRPLPWVVGWRPFPHRCNWMVRM